MKKFFILTGFIALVGAGIAYYTGAFNRDSATEAAAQERGGQGDGRGGFGGFGGGGFRAPMTVALTRPTRATVAQQLVVVGNLIGDTTVAVAPKTAGRLEAVYVRLGDRVQPGQRIAKIEDQEALEQVRQAEAAFEVAHATIRQREADLQLAQTNVERARNLFGRQLLPRQTLDDNEARYQAAIAQLDLARAQNTQSQARLEELRINLANTLIVSPLDGFVARRAADPGAFVSQNAPVVDVVDINRVRLVANVVEKDLSQVQTGEMARVEVDAYPGEIFFGRIARVAPVLDPATRTAPIEVEIPNAGFRLKPGMYARISITTVSRTNALVVPANAVVDVSGKRGVFLANDDNRVSFRPVEVGIEEPTQIEILNGLTEADSVVTTGAAGLTDGAQVVIATEQSGGEAGRGQGDGGGRRNRSAADGEAAASQGSALDLSSGSAESGRGFGGRGSRGSQSGQPASEGAGRGAAPGTL
jgi:RND family efflux transporter MFP subunit